MKHTYDAKNFGNEIVEYLKEWDADTDAYTITRNDEMFFTAKAGARLRFIIYLPGMVLQTREISLKLDDDCNYSYILHDMGSINVEYLQTGDETLGFEVAAKI